MNSIALDFDSNIVISSRNLSEITKIDRQTGEIIWRFGGQNNQFEIENDDYGISYQHDVRPVPGMPNRYTIFDNGANRYPEFSRAVEFEIDTTNMTAKKTWEYTPFIHIFSSYMGNAQRLPNGNTLINWADGNLPKVTEVTREGDIVYKLNFDGIVYCYRSFRFEWEGVALVPYLIAEPSSDKVTLIFNKFGDDDVKEYRIFGGYNPQSDDLLAISQEPFYHLSELENHETYYFRVTAVDSIGIESGFSNEEEVFVNFTEPCKDLILNGDFSLESEYWELGISGTAVAQELIEDSIYHIKIDSSSVFYSDVQLRQNNLDIIEGKHYILEFDAWSTELKYFEVKVQKEIAPWTDYSRIGAAYATTAKKHYLYEFTMNDLSDYSASVVFNCGQSVADLFLDNVSLTCVDTITNINVSVNQPAKYHLSANYPNPFNPVTRIDYQLPANSEVELSIHNTLGQMIAILVSGRREAGMHKVEWDAAEYASGIYFYRMKARTSGGKIQYHQVKKMILLK
jgi:hypothetical protein